MMSRFSTARVTELQKKLESVLHRGQVLTRMETEDLFDLCGEIKSVFEALER